MILHIRRCLIALLLLCTAGAASIAQIPGRGVRVLNIDEAVRIAVEENLNVEAARTRVETAGAHVTSSFGTFLPQINISSGYTRQLSDGTVVVQGTPIPGDRPRDNLNASVSASLLLFDGFSRTANYSASQSDLNASLETLNRTREDAAFQARSAFLTVLRSEQIVDVRRNDLEVNREQLARTRGLVEAGAAQIGTVYSQEAEVANAELALETATTDLIVAYNTLKLVLNINAAEEIQVTAEGLANSVDSLEIVDARRRLGSMEELTAKLTERRRDIQAARLRVESARSLVTASKSGYYPSISASLGYSWQAAGDITSDNSSLGLSLQYSPFDGFRTSEQVEIARAQLQTAEIDLRRLEIQTQSDLRQSLARFEGSERQLRAASKATAAARQNRFAADERYKIGVGNYSDYLLANAQYLNAQINQVNAIFNYRISLYDVLYQIGE